MKNISRTILVFLFLTLIIYMSCKDETSSPTYKCDQSCQDENTAYGLVTVFTFIWNQNISGQPAGPKDFTVNGPQGGSIHVTGSTAFSNGINTANLIFDFTDCKGGDENYSLTFNGVVSMDGTFNSTYKAVTYASPSLRYQGTVGKNANVPVNATCQITINETLSHLSGNICGRDFSYK